MVSGMSFGEFSAHYLVVHHEALVEQAPPTSEKKKKYYYTVRKLKKLCEVFNLHLKKITVLRTTTHVITQEKTKRTGLKK